MNITLNFDTLYNKVARSLSIIGKRSTDENGNPLFGEITLSSLEKGIIQDFFHQATIAITVETSAFISGSSSTTDLVITLTFPTNHNSQLDTFIQHACEEYCVCYALYSWFVITAPKISEKYNKDSINQLAALVRLVHEKVPEVSLSNPLAIGTTVSSNP